MATVNSGGRLFTDGSFVCPWDGLAVAAADMYSNWVEVSRPHDGFVSFQYDLTDGGGTAWTGTIRVQATNCPDDDNLKPENVTLDDDSTGVAVAAAAANGIISLRKKAKYYRMFMDYTSGDVANKISAVAHQ